MKNNCLVIVFLLLFAVVGCSQTSTSIETPVIGEPSRDIVRGSTPAAVSPPTSDSDVFPTAVVDVRGVTPTSSPTRAADAVFDAAIVLGTLAIDIPIQSLRSTILTIPPCRVENAPKSPTSVFLGTVPLPTPTPDPDPTQNSLVSKDEIELQRYIKTMYPSLVTALGWAVAVEDIDIASLDGGAISTLLYMESSRLDAVCRAVALISPAQETENFHTELFSGLLERHAALGEVRTMNSSADGDLGRIMSTLSLSSETLENLNSDLEELADASGLVYPPPLSGLIFSSRDLGLELSIPPGWQVTDVIGNLSLLAPPRMQGGGVQDVGSHFGANGSEFKYSKLRNPSDFDERDALERIGRLLQPFGEFVSEAPDRIASQSAHVLEYLDRENELTTYVWVVTRDGFSHIFRVSCPADVIDGCVEDILPMLESTKLIE